ncbi:hypothetical protein [uncultured Roseibium sp.]|uniref:hypothetical protein n=1 Tax=uncultured Roseibium sp. TaxID=1936171 RepID=UPI002636251E|nr:hypothetical protein [uncultured Roseibium sp.]
MPKFRIVADVEVEISCVVEADSFKRAVELMESSLTASFDLADVPQGSFQSVEECILSVDITSLKEGAE